MEKADFEGNFCRRAHRQFQLYFKLSFFMRSAWSFSGNFKHVFLKHHFAGSPHPCWSVFNWSRKKNPPHAQDASPILRMNLCVSSVFIITQQLWFQIPHLSTVTHRSVDNDCQKKTSWKIFSFRVFFALSKTMANSFSWKPTRPSNATERITFMQPN